MNLRMRRWKPFERPSLERERPLLGARASSPAFVVDLNACRDATDAGEDARAPSSHARAFSEGVMNREEQTKSPKPDNRCWTLSSSLKNRNRF
jgi:hypothetical protein